MSKYLSVTAYTYSPKNRLQETIISQIVPDTDRWTITDPRKYLKMIKRMLEKLNGQYSRCKPVAAKMVELGKDFRISIGVADHIAGDTIAEINIFNISEKTI